MKKIFVIILILGGGFAAWKFWLKPKEEVAPAYREIKVGRGDIRVTILATGTILPQNRVELGSPVSGRIDDILVREGDRVTKGQVLAWVSSTDRAALLDAARSRGEDEMKRWEEIYKPTPLIAPLDGEIIARKLEPGQSISPETPILVMSDRLIVEAQVDETDIARISKDQEVEIQLDAYPDRILAGVVDHVAYEAETVENVTIYKIDVLPRDPPEFLRSGMTASLTFVVESKKNVLLLPTEAFKDNKVLVTGAVEKEIETGLDDGKQLEVVSGLSDGDIVLVAGDSQLAADTNNPKTNPLMPFNRWSSRRRR